MSESIYRPPSALVELDEQLGSRLVVAHQYAVESAPHLAPIEVCIAPVDGETQFRLHPYGLMVSHINLNPDPNYYANLLSLHWRPIVQESVDFFESQGITAGAAEIIVFALLHEMGHADDYYSLLTQAQGDLVDAWKLWNQTKKSQMEALSLAQANPLRKKVMRAYMNRKQPERFHVSKWDDALLESAEEYAAVPFERIPTKFALGVLATMYS